MVPSKCDLVGCVLLSVLFAGSMFPVNAVADAPPAWKIASVIKLSRHTVALSQPVLVARSTGRLWFPSLFNLGEGRLAAVLNLDSDTPLQHPKAKYLWSNDNGSSWG